MSDNKNNAPVNNNGAKKSGEKKSDTNNKNRPRRPASDSAKSGDKAKSSPAGRGAEEYCGRRADINDNKRKSGERHDGRVSGSSKNGKGRSPKGKRPQIHDGFDDIKMKPHYVMVDGGDYDDEDYTDGSVCRGSSNPGVTVGRNAVRELLRSGRPVDKIYVKSGGREGSVVVIVAEAVSRGIPIVEVDQSRLDRIAGGGNHQGVAAMAAGKEYVTIDDILEIAASRGEKPLIAVSDGIEDPHNLGALIRCAECAGAHGIIIPKRRAVGITPAVVKCSAGAVEHIAVARVSNIAAALKDLKDAGVWVFAAEAGGEAYYEADMSLPAAIVFGSEGGGVSRLVKDRADFTVSIPMYGLVNSLNVSTAASVILCHAARARHGKA